MAFKTKPLRYLGAISGRGVVKQNGETIAPAKFDLDGYYRAPVGVTGSGEINGRAKCSNVCSAARTFNS